MKNIALFLVALICSQALVLALPENLALGPYKVSFDMGIDDLMNWVISGPTNSETMDGSLTSTKYSATPAILTESQFVSESKRLGRSPSSHSVFIHIIQYNSTKDESANGTRTMVDSVLTGYADATISKRTIDGRRGTIGSGTKGNTETMYIADWWMENNTMVYVISFYPWDEGTLSLLKSIHVERINSAS